MFIVLQEHAILANQIHADISGNPLFTLKVFGFVHTC